MHAHRSGCPINLTRETLGDRWSLIVIRDVMFGNRRHFRVLLGQSEEGIASNILAGSSGSKTRASSLAATTPPTHKQKAIYSLTEPANKLVPLRAQMRAWGRRHTPSSKELAVRAEILEAGGPKLWSRIMSELRHLHLGAPRPKLSVLAELRSAYEDATAKAGFPP